MPTCRARRSGCGAQCETFGGRGGARFPPTRSPKKPDIPRAAGGQKQPVDTSGRKGSSTTGRRGRSRRSTPVTQGFVQPSVKDTQNQDVRPESTFTVFPAVCRGEKRRRQCLPRPPCAYTYRVYRCKPRLFGSVFEFPTPSVRDRNLDYVLPLRVVSSPTQGSGAKEVFWVGRTDVGGPTTCVDGYWRTGP